jgi:hypothetical protein
MTRLVHGTLVDGTEGKGECKMRDNAERTIVRGVVLAGAGLKAGGLLNRYTPIAQEGQARKCLLARLEENT